MTLVTYWCVVTDIGYCWCVVIDTGHAPGALPLTLVTYRCVFIDTGHLVVRFY